MSGSKETAEQSWNNFFAVRDRLDIPIYNNVPYARGTVDNRWAQLEAAVTRVRRIDKSDATAIELLSLLILSAERSADYAERNHDFDRVYTFMNLGYHYENTLTAFTEEMPIVGEVVGNNSVNAR